MEYEEMDCTEQTTMTREEYYARIAQARKDMDCDSGHCSSCAYLNEYGGCDLSESIYAGE